MRHLTHDVSRETPKDENEVGRQRDVEVRQQQRAPLQGTDVVPCDVQGNPDLVDVHLS